MIVLALAAALVVLAPASAPSLPAGWRPARLSDIAQLQKPRGHYSDAEARAKFAATADFDGDGRPDRAQVAVDRTAGRFALFVLTTQPLKLWEGPLQGMPDISIGAVPAGKYADGCPTQARCERPLEGGVRIERPGLMVRKGPDVADLYWWTGSDFASHRVLGPPR